MIATHGGLVGGYGLYVREGKPTFVYNYLALDRSTVAGKEPLPKGKVQLKVDFAYGSGGGGLGKGAAVTLTVSEFRWTNRVLRRSISCQVMDRLRGSVSGEYGAGVVRATSCQVATSHTPGDAGNLAKWPVKS
jgi:hypothetical protein